METTGKKPNKYLVNVTQSCVEVITFEVLAYSEEEEALENYTDGEISEIETFQDDNPYVHEIEVVGTVEPHVWETEEIPNDKVRD